ncbi:MAG: hypothetical protein WBZ24_00565 [Anaerolineales bacterium]
MHAGISKRMIRWTWAGVNGFLILSIAYALAILLSTITSPWIGGQQNPLGAARLRVQWTAGASPLDGAQLGTPGTGATYEDVVGSLLVDTPNVGWVAVANLPDLLAAIGLAFIFFNLRKILDAVLAGDPFAEQGGVHLRRLGITGLAMGLLLPLVQSGSSLVLLAQLAPAGSHLQPGPVFNGWAILGGLLGMILSQVWSYGLDLERDRQLTI